MADAVVPSGRVVGARGGVDLTRGGSGEVQLDQFNQLWRSSPVYAEIMRSIGVDPSRPMRLTDNQRRQVLAMARSRGAQVPEGLEIDPAGNWNQNEGFGVQLRRWGPAAAAAALAAFGIPGVMPGLLTNSGAAAGAGAAGATGGGAGGGLASGALAGLHTAVPGAVTSQGVSSAIAGLTGAGLAAAATKGGGIMDWIGRLLGGDGDGGDGDGFDMGDLSDILGAGGAVMGAAGQQAANSRADQLNASVLQNEINRQAEDDFRRALAERERVGMETRNDARRNLQYGEYLAGGGSEYTAPEGTTAIGFGPKAATENERTGGAALRDEANARLLGGNPMPEPVKNTYTIPEDLLRPGTFETVANVVSPGLSIFSMIDQIRRNRG